MKEQVLITNNGNFLRFNSEKQKFYFQKPNGEFLRQVSPDEAEHIGPNLILAEIPSSHLTPHPKMPNWKYVGQFNSMNDYTNFKPETCNNGGDYSFHEYSDIFVALVNEKWIFREAVRKTTSAEFDYDNLTGNFNQVEPTYVWNSDWGSFYWSNGNDVMLEQISQEVSFDYVWNLGCAEYDLTDDGEIYSTVKPITFADRKDIVLRCKELGVDLRQGYVQNKVGRNGKIKKGWQKYR